jgi:hypothetical protein
MLKFSLYWCLNYKDILFQLTLESMARCTHAFFLWILFLFCSCEQNAENVSSKNENTNSQPQQSILKHQEHSTITQVPVAQIENSLPQAEPTSDYAFNIIPGEENTFGYEIIQNGKPLIRQTTIPGMPGNKGFVNQADAEKVANLVVRKLKKGEMPPTVLPEELKQLNVIK